MTAPDLPGMKPSPFDPSPPWDRAAAAGLGAFYGAIVRRLDRELSVDGFDASAWTASQIQAAQQREAITAQDAARLSALLAPAADEPPPSAAQLFAEAMDDPASSPLAIGILSIGKYKEEHTMTDRTGGPGDRSDFLVGVILGITGGGLPYLVATEVADHVHVTIT